MNNALKQYEVASTNSSMSFKQFQSPIKSQKGYTKPANFYFTIAVVLNLFSPADPLCPIFQFFQEISLIIRISQLSVKQYQFHKFDHLLEFYVEKITLNKNFRLIVK